MIYHSMPRDIFMDERYLNTISMIGENIMHVLDSPEGNLPLLLRSKAYNFHESIKQICPNIFPGIDHENLLHN